VLKVSRSAFYAFRSGQTYQLSVNKKLQIEQVKHVFQFHKRRYGSRRIVAELKAGGNSIGRDRVRSLMKTAHLQAIQPRSFVPKTTDSGHNKRNSPNLLLDEWGNRLFLAQAPNQVWVSDITYLPLNNGDFIYLGMWMDLFSRLIVGWRVDENMEEKLISEPLKKALQLRKPLEGLILHSDRGGQYVAINLRKQIKKYRQSMSRKDNCYDNAFAESFFGRFKTELLEGGAFENLQEAKNEVFEFIEVYYNRQRRHSSLNYQTPLAFEQNYYLTLNLP